MQNLPPQTQNRLQGFAGAFPAICPILRPLSGCASCYAVHPARRWRTYKQAQRLHRYQIPPPRRTQHRTEQPPIIIIYTGVYAGASLLWIHARRCSILQTMQARRGLLLSCAECWQVLTHCQHYRPGAPTEGVSVSTCTWSARRRLDASHARRFAVWHWVNGQSAQGQLGTLHPAGSPVAGARRAARNHW
jgi:hypothetical protein